MISVVSGRAAASPQGNAAALFVRKEKNENLEKTVRFFLKKEI